MRSNSDSSPRWEAFGRRIALCVVVICSHLGLLMLLLHARGPLWHDQHRASPVKQHILIRLIQLAPPRPAGGSARNPALQLKPVPAHRHPVWARTHARVTPVRTHDTAPDARLANPASMNAEPTPGYIAGGNLLHGDTLDRSPSMRLPGSDVAVVPGLHMVDPRTQGVAGVARMLQGMLGVPDPHCVKVDAWRTLSIRDMLAQHISPGQVQKTAEEYGCLPKP